MLPELLQGTDAGGFLIIQDSINYSGRHLLRSFINAALNREETVHVLGFEVSEEELKDGLKGSAIQRLHFHDAYTDPLGWTDHPAFTVHQFRLEQLTHLIKQTSQHKPATLVIDSLSWILRHRSSPDVCRTLQQLRKGGAVRAIIGLLHTDMHQWGTVGSVCHLATSVITVAPGMKGDEAVAKTTKRSKSGKVMQEASSVSMEMTSFSCCQKLFITFFVLRRRFSVSKKISQSCYRVNPAILDPNRLTLRNRRRTRQPT